MRSHLLVLSAFALITLVATHPLWQAVTEHVPGDIGDPLLNTYILGWDTRALVGDPLNLFNAGFFYPLPNALAYSENLIGNALLALPVALVGGPVLAYNFVFLLSFVLSGYGMYVLFLHLTHRRAAAFIAGLAFAFAPYRMASLAHIQLLTMQWLPWMICSLWLMISAGGWQLQDGGRAKVKRLGLFLLFFWMQIASSLHGALFASFILALWLAARWSVRVLRPSLRAITTQNHGIATFRPGAALRNILSVLLCLVVFVGLLVPFVLPYVSIMTELRAARPSDVALPFVAAPTDFLAAYPANVMYGAGTTALRQREGFTEEHTLFMGLAIPCLALLGLWQSVRRISTASGCASLNTEVFNAGALWLGGLLVVSAALTMSSWLIQMLPLASLMRVPARWGMVIAFALAGLIAVAVAAFFTKHKRNFRLAYWAIAVAILLDGFSAPLPLVKIGALSAVPPIYHQLMQQPGREAIIELPMFVAPEAEYPEGKRMYATLLHGRALVNGYSGFTPQRQLALAAQLKRFPDEASFVALRALRVQGVRFLIVHSGEPGLPRREWTQTKRIQAIQSGVVRLIQTVGDDELYEILR